MSQIKERARRALVRLTRLLAARLGYDMVWRDYYSPIPDVGAIPEPIWTSRSDLVGVDFGDSGRQLEYLSTRLAGFVEEFEPPPDFRLDNGSYGAVDAEVLYGMVRAHKPKRVLEIGAGFSTLVTAAACDRNARDGHDVRFAAVDPYPPAWLKKGVTGLSELRERKTTDLPLGAFTELEEGDILFLDTTHTVKLGGDVTHLILESLPRLAPGVIIHIHDVFLPWHYPRRWLERDAYYWAEQYLVQAFLCFNSQFEVLLSCHLLSRDRPAELAALVPSFNSDAAPAALWLRRTATR